MGTSSAAATSIDPALELAERARSGDRAALDELYRQHREPVFRHAWRMLGEKAAAHDVVQEAFARALVAVAETRPGLNFRAWIFRIATNLCLRELNRRGRSTGELDEERPAKTPGPQELASRQELAQQLSAILARLPERYRQILLLRELEELSYAELAHALKLSEANVKVLLHRARLRFAALFCAAQISAPSATQLLESFDCEELERLQLTARREALERHLERCPRCHRSLERIAPTDVLALLPAPPMVTFAEPSAPSSTVGGGASAAASSSVLPWAAAAGAVLLAATIAVAGAFWPRASQPAASTTSAAPARPPTRNVAARAAAPVATSPLPAEAAPGVEQPPRLDAPSSAPTGGERKATTHTRRRRRALSPSQAAKRTTPTVVEQVADPEEAPPR